MNTMRHQAGRSRCAAKHRGVSAVEFALTAPILFLFLFATLEFGRYNMILQTTNEAAFEAARACIVPGAAASDGETAGRNIINAAGLSGGTVTINPATITTTTPQVTATVTVSITSNLWTSALFCKSGTTTKSCTLTCDWLDSTQ
jgi:Flp pilus assembly protein TadG